MISFVESDYAGMVTVITALTAFVGACAAAYIKILHELAEINRQNHGLSRQNDGLKEQNEDLKEQVNGNLSHKIENLTDEVGGNLAPKVEAVHDVVTKKLT